MDPNMENYFRMQQSGGYKIPFYMAYPMQDVYLSEIEYERDRERLKKTCIRKKRSAFRG